MQLRQIRTRTRTKSLIVIKSARDCHKSTWKQKYLCVLVSLSPIRKSKSVSFVINSYQSVIFVSESHLLLCGFCFLHRATSRLPLKENGPILLTHVIQNRHARPFVVVVFVFVSSLPSSLFLLFFHFCAQNQPHIYKHTLELINNSLLLVFSFVMMRFLSFVHTFLQETFHIKSGMENVT